MMKNLKNLFDQFNWEKADNYPDGTFKKTLREEDGAKTILLRLPEGFSMELHSHVTTEQQFILKGSYTNKGIAYHEGSYQVFYTHEEHGPFYSKDGALVLVIWDPYDTAE